MILTFQISGDKLAHANHHQFGAIVAHCMKSKNYHSMKVWKTMLEVSFAVGTEGVLGAQRTIGELEADLMAIVDLEPMACPCGCGRYLVVGPCMRQSGEMISSDLTQNEIALIQANNKIGAIKEVRIRTGKGLRDAKDMVDAYINSIPLVGVQDNLCADF